MTDAELNLAKPLVLVGMMGAGKTAIGKRLAAKLKIPFTDVDLEIEKAAGCSIADFFQDYGEDAFRDGERRVIKRLLSEPIGVLATGGGAFMDEGTRKEISQNGISVWLRADLETLWRRVSRDADRTVVSTDGSPEAMVGQVLDAVRDYLNKEKQDD